MLLSANYQILAPHKLPEGRYIEAAVIQRSWREIRTFFIEVPWPHTTQEYGDAWSFGLFSETGFACRLSVFDMMPSATRLWVREGDPRVDDDATDLLLHMGLGRAEVLFFWKDVGFHPHTLWRQDDNSNEFVVNQYPTKFEAIWAQREYEAKGHKQTYWVRRASKQA